jgi:multidrug efflux pump subunit AcrA (membrane-fusion protein)
MRHHFSAPIILTLFLNLLWISACTANKKGFHKGGSLVGRVAKSDLIQRVTIAGVIAPARTTNIAPPYSGYVKKLYVNVGDKVKVGTPIVSVSQTLTGTEPVFPMQSPLEGIVVQVNRTEGDYVRENYNEFILRIDDPSKYIVKADTPEIDRIKVKVGQKAVIKVNAIIGKTYEGTIHTIARAPTVRDSWRSTTVDYATVVELENPDELIHSGMTTLVDVIVAKREKVLTLRHEFVQKDAKGFFVIRANDERQSITVGLQNEEAFEITSGLNEGDEVKPVDFGSLAEARD